MNCSEVKDILEECLKGKFRIFDKEVKAQKLSGVIYIPKKYINRRVIIILAAEDNPFLLE